MSARKRSSVRRSALRLEELESRRVPATLVDPTTVTFRDVDGDQVNIVLSQPLFTSLNVNGVLTFNTGNVNGSNTASQQLQKVDLTALGSAAASLSITITADPDPVTHSGDGFVNVGAITSPLRLQDVTVDGDLGRIEAHAPAGSIKALGTLTVRSLGKLGTATQPSIGANLESDLFGSVKAINVATDIVSAFINVHKRNPVDATDPGSPGAIDAVFVGGSLKGGTAVNSGRIQADGRIGALTIQGSILGGAGTGSGAVLAMHGNIATVTIGGDVRGGTTAETGFIEAADGRVITVTITGSLIGGGNDDTGKIEASRSIASVSVGKDVQDGRIVSPGGGIRSVVIGGSVSSGPSSVFGSISAGNALVSVQIAGDLIGTLAIPVVISARGKAVVPLGSNSDVAIGSLTVGGKVEFADVLAGYNTNLLGVNADAQIGKVQVNGDWTASNLVAGARPGGDAHFGTSDDFKMKGPGVNDQPTITAKIKKIVIGGQVRGTTATNDHYGFVAERIVSLQVGANLITLQLGPHNDHAVNLATTNDVSVFEV